ncbi:hypothetical protein KQX54_004777 [Cotesia glomerata]|uniref:Uncharacterized protein n=1 Tax=Cotesia glomerata TaxID=32391 RepID=A0AAV7IIB0_COTGL|nr:hypothetical protein KQX54_004777 [Cotesia glomerata]
MIPKELITNWDTQGEYLRDKGHHLCRSNRNREHKRYASRPTVVQPSQLVPHVSFSSRILPTHQPLTRARYDEMIFYNAYSLYLPATKTN